MLPPFVVGQLGPWKNVSDRIMSMETCCVSMVLAMMSSNVLMGVPVLREYSLCG